MQVTIRRQSWPARLPDSNQLPYQVQGPGSFNLTESARAGKTESIGFLKQSCLLRARERFPGTACLLRAQERFPGTVFFPTCFYSQKNCTNRKQMVTVSERGAMCLSLAVSIRLCLVASKVQNPKKKIFITSNLRYMHGVLNIDKIKN